MSLYSEEQPLAYRSNDFSRLFRGEKATEVATTMSGILVNMNRGKRDMNVALRMVSLCQS